MNITELNQDQQALLRWILAGLQIKEVRALHGDAKYLLSNMIAKFSLSSSTYRLSKGAELRLRSNGVDLAKIHKRTHFYGKGSPFIYEHAVPCALVRQQLLSVRPTLKAVKNVLVSAGPVIMVLRTEDTVLRNHGLMRSMPEGWSWGDNSLARYRATGIRISRTLLKVDGQIER